MGFQEMLLTLSAQDGFFLITAVVFVLAFSGFVITEIKIEKSTTRDKYGFACTTAPLFFGSVFSLVLLAISTPALIVQSLVYVASYIFPAS